MQQCEGTKSLAFDVPLVDFPESQVLDSLNLLNKVVGQCIIKKIANLLIFFGERTEGDPLQGAKIFIMLSSKYKVQMNLFPKLLLKC